MAGKKKTTKKEVVAEEYTQEQEAQIQANYDNMTEAEKANLEDPSELVKKESRKQTLARMLAKFKDEVLTAEVAKEIMLEVYPAVEKVRKDRGPTIAHMIVTMMVENREKPTWTDEEIVDAVQTEFEGKKADKKHVAYYRSAINVALKDISKARHLNLLPTTEDGKPDLSVLPLGKVIINSKGEKVLM